MILAHSKGSSKFSLQLLDFPFVLIGSLDYLTSDFTTRSRKTRGSFSGSDKINFYITDTLMRHQ